MRFPGLARKRGMILLGLFLISFGSASWLFAQRTPASQILRLTLDGAYMGIQMEDWTADNRAKYKLPGETGLLSARWRREARRKLRVFLRMT